MTIRSCSEPDCDRPIERSGLCVGHSGRQRNGSSKTGPISAAQILTDEPHAPCPPGALELAAAVAELDAQAILRAIIWPHILEASIAGTERFALEAP